MIGLGRRRFRHGVSSRRAELAQRAHRKRVWRRLGLAGLLAGIALALVWAGWQLLAPGRVPISQIRISGLDTQRQAELRPLLADYWGQNYFTLNLSELRARLLTNPWLADVSIRRQWPNRLTIQARQRRVAAFWGDKELLADDGRRFRPQRLPQQDWPRLAGPVGQERVVLDAYRRATALIAPLGLQVVGLRQNPRLGWRLQLAGGVEIILSQDSLGNGLLIRQLKRFAAAYRHTLKTRFARIAAIDMRYGKGFSVRWLTPPAATSAV